MADAPVPGTGVLSDVRVRPPPGAQGVVSAHLGEHARRLAVGWAPETPECGGSRARTALWRVNRPGRRASLLTSARRPCVGFDCSALRPGGRTGQGAGVVWKANGRGNSLGLVSSVLRSWMIKPSWRRPPVRSGMSAKAQGVGSSVIRSGKCPAGAGAGFEHPCAAAMPRRVGTSTFRLTASTQPVEGAVLITR